MKSKLKAVAPKTAKPSKPKVLIFGKPGVGKTWSALDFPNVYYIDTEGGANMGHYTDKLESSGGVYLGVEQGSLDPITILEQIKALATEKHIYKTVVIDSISKIFNNEVAKEAERLADAGTKNEFGLDRKPAVAWVRQLIRWIERIDMNVILIAHEKTSWGVINGQRTEIGVTFDAYDKLEYELHLALNIQKQAGKRIARIRKSRLKGFPEEESFNWGYQEFAEKYGKDIIEKDVELLVLATEEQLAEIERLIKKAILPDGIQNKWFAAANVSNFAEMDSDKIEAIIKLINDKYLPKIGE